MSGGVWFGEEGLKGDGRHLGLDALGRHFFQFFWWCLDGNRETHLSGVLKSWY